LYYMVITWRWPLTKAETCRDHGEHTIKHIYGLLRTRVFVLWFERWNVHEKINHEWWEWGTCRERGTLLMWVGENLCSFFTWPNLMYINMACNAQLAVTSLGSYHTLLNSCLCFLFQTLSHFLLSSLFNMGFLCLFFPFVLFFFKLSLRCSLLPSEYLSQGHHGDWSSEERKIW
jgi:hypothetical protein